MVVNLNWKKIKGWKIRINAAWRCLRKKHYVLVCWDRCPDGEIDFLISHKGAELSEAAHRCRVDAAEILQDLCDQNAALDGVDEILRK